MNAAADSVAVAPPASASETGLPSLALTAAIIAAVALATARFPDLLAPFPGDIALPLHTLLEIAAIAAFGTMALLAWQAPRGRYRLRTIAVACLCTTAAIFNALHLLTYPGLPDFIVGNNVAVSFYFSRLARLALPAAFICLALIPSTLRIASSLRWSALSATLAGLMPLIWYGLSQGVSLPDVQVLEDGTVRHMSVIRWTTVALFAAAAVIARRGDLDADDARQLARAALLCAVGEACIVHGAGAMNFVNLCGHLGVLIGTAAAISAFYGDCVGLPYRWMEQAHATTLMDKERGDAVLRAIADGVIVVDADMVVTTINPVARHVVARPDPALAGLPLSEALASFSPDIRSAILRDVEACLAAGPHEDGTRFREWCIGEDRYVIERHISPVRDPSGAIRGAVIVLRDVTERRRMLDELGASVDYARNLFNASLDPMFVVALDGNITDVNSAAQKVAGMPRSDMVGSRFAGHFTEPEAADDALRRALPDGSVRDLSLVAVRPDGGVTEVSCNITPYRDAAGTACGAFVIARDVTEMRQVQLQLQFQASCDALTALPNRRLFRERIERAIAHAKRSGRLAAILIVDIDDFKDINDALGHEVGDDLIKAVADRLVNALRETDTAARLGGDEFGILVEDLARPEDVQPVSAKLLDVVSQPFRFADSEVIVGCSIGISVFPNDQGDAETLVRNAHTAMSRAKEAGKNACRFFTPDMNATVQRRVDLGNRLRNALQRGEFTLVYQPQVALASGDLVGNEALLRWAAEGIGPVSPIEFIPIAEDSGLIGPIGDWVLREACRQAAAWRAETGRDVSIAVNLSARQFCDDNVVAAVTRALEDSGLPPALLELELTESLLVHDPERVSDTLTALKSLGVRIAVDDFGTGYSSLAYLKRFPLDYLKVDRSFVSDVPGDRNDEAIVRSIVALAHSLGLKVIAEGVETTEQISFLSSLRCDEIQGYYISPPRPPEEILDFIGLAGKPPGSSARC